MYAELMNENIRIRAENAMLLKIVLKLITQANENPFVSVGHFVEHGDASSAIAKIRAFTDEPVIYQSIN